MMFKSLNNKFWIVGIVVAIALLLILEQFVSTFWVRILTGLFMWIGLAMSWNIVGGYTGYINFGHGAFFGIGAYVTGLMLLGRLGIRFPFFPALILGALSAAVVAAIIGLPTLRLRGAYFAIATWAFAEGIRQLALVLGITGGAFGINLPPVLNERFFFMVMLVMALLTFILTRVWRKIFPNPINTGAYGITAG
jgi:branched-chain amino acid transport system permease protein